MTYPVGGLSGCSGKDAYTFSVFETAALKYLGTGRPNFSLLDSYVLICILDHIFRIIILLQLSKILFLILIDFLKFNSDFLSSPVNELCKMYFEK